MPGKFLEFIKAGKYAIPVEISFLPVTFYDEIQGKEVTTSKWVSQHHWKEIKAMLKPAVESVLRFNEEAIVDSKLTKNEHIVHGKEISIGYMISPNKDKSPFMSLLDTKSNCWTDDEEDSVDGREQGGLLDMGGNYKSLTPAKYYVRAIVLEKSDSETDDTRKLYKELGVKTDDLRNYFSTSSLEDPGSSKQKSKFSSHHSRHHTHHHRHRSEHSDRHSDKSLSPVFHRRHKPPPLSTASSSVTSGLGLIDDQSESTETYDREDSGVQGNLGQEEDSLRSEDLNPPEPIQIESTEVAEGSYYEEEDVDRSDIDSLLSNPDPFEMEAHPRDHFTDLFPFHDFHADADADDDDDDFSLPDIDTPIKSTVYTKQKVLKKKILEPSTSWQPNHPTTNSSNARRKSSELDFSSDGGEKGKRKRPPRKKKETSPNRHLSFEDSIAGKRKSTSSPHSAERGLKSIYSHSESLQKTIENVSKEADEMMKEKAQMVEREYEKYERELNQDLKEMHKSSPEKSSSSRGHIKKYNAELVERLLHDSVRQSSKRSNSPSKTDSRASVGEDPYHSDGTGRSRNKSGEKKRSRAPGPAKKKKLTPLGDEIEPNSRSKKKRSRITLPKKKPTAASTSTTAALTSSSNPLSNTTNITASSAQLPSSAIIIKAKKFPQPPSSTVTSFFARDSSPTTRDPSMPILMPMVNSSSPPEDRELIPREIPVLEPARTPVKTKAAAKRFLPSLFQKAHKLRVPKSPKAHTLSTEKVTPLGNHYQVQIHPPKERLLSVSEESTEGGLNAVQPAGKNSNTLPVMQNSSGSQILQQNNNSDLLTQPLVRSDSVSEEEERPQGEKEPEKVKSPEPERPKKTGKRKVSKSKVTCEIAVQTDTAEQGGAVDQAAAPEEEEITIKIEKDEDSKEELLQKIQFTATPDEVCEIDPFSFESVNLLPNMAISTSFYNSMVQRVTTPPIPRSFSPSSAVASTSGSLMGPPSVPGPSTSMPPPTMRPPRTQHVKKTLPNPQFNKSSSNESSVVSIGGRPTRPEDMSTYQLLSDPNILRAGLNLLNQMSTNRIEVEEAGRRLGYDVRSSPTKRRPASPDITHFGKKIKEEDSQDEEEPSGPRRGRSANKVNEQQTSQQQTQEIVDDDAEENPHEEGEVLMRELLNRFDEHSAPYQPRGDEFDLSQRSICMTNIVQDYPRKSRAFKMHSKNIKELSHEDLISNFNHIKKEVKDVYDGRLPSHRQMIFNQGTQSRRSLHELVLSLPFTNQQATHIIAFLYEYLFPDKDTRMRAADYISLVALSETFMRIYARVNNISINLAETEMRFGGVYEEEVGGYDDDD